MGVLEQAAEEIIPKTVQSESPPRVLTLRIREIVSMFPTLTERSRVFREQGLSLDGTEVWLLMKGSDQELGRLFKEVSRREHRWPFGNLLKYAHARIP